MPMEFVIKRDDIIVGNRDLCTVISRIGNLGLKRAMILLKGSDAIYYSNCEGIDLVIKLPKSNIGASKFHEKRLIEKFKVKLRLKSVEKVFELAKEIENMDFETFVKTKVRENDRSDIL